jgi:hypothetical protein
MFKPCDFTEVNISKYNAINSSCFINSKFQTDCSQICWLLYSYLQSLELFIVCMFNMQKYLEHIKTQGQLLKTCKLLILLLITYLHWWCNILNNKNILMNKIIYHIYYIYMYITFHILNLKYFLSLCHLSNR